MSAEKRRNMLYIFAGVVVALLAVIAFVSPRFRSEDASGAIGAVQKHRAPQIKQADVVLGDEQFKNEQKAVYGDYLTEAAVLQNVSADIALAARQLKAQDNFAAAHADLQSREADLRARYVANAEALDAALGSKLMAARDQHAQLAAADMETLNAKLNAEIMALDAKARVQNLGAIESSLADMQSRIAANKLNLAGASADLASLDAKYAALNQRANLNARYETLNAMAKESHVLSSADDALAALMSRTFNANDRALLASADEIAAQLGDEAAALESAAVQAMNARLVSNEAAVETLGKSVAQLDSMKQVAESRSATYNAQALHDFDVALAAAHANLQGRITNLQSRQAMAMHFQLAAIRNMVDNQSQAGDRIATLNNQALASHINNAATLNALGSHLAVLNQRAQSNALASAMPDAQAFASNVKMVMDKTTNLQARNAH